jgi:hypothetical protein
MASRARFRVVYLGLVYGLRADAMANLLVPRSIKKEMKGTLSVQKSKEESKGISNPNPKIRARDSPPSPPPNPTPLDSGKGSNHHHLPSVCGRWVASDPPKGATVDRLDGDALPLGSVCVDEWIHDSAAALALRARRARSTESPSHQLPSLSGSRLARPRGGNGLGFRGARPGTSFVSPKSALVRRIKIYGH